MDAVADAKEVLRRRMRVIRRSIPPAERARRAPAMTARVMALPEIASARVVLAFSSFGSEIPTAGLLRALEEAGARVLLPYLEAGGMHAAPYRSGDPLVPTTYGPQEPAVHRAVPLDSIDAVIAPGLAFDRRGGRLGFGAGWYDRFLAELDGRAAVVGVAFAEQVVAEVPVVAGDVPVDIVVTDEEAIDCRDERGQP